MPEERNRAGRRDGPRGEAEQGVDGHRYTVVPRVLCFLRSGQEVLLLQGAAGKRLWTGRYNGIGGHMERGEDPLQAARREIYEETGLQVETLHLGGIIHISLSQGSGVLLFLFVGEAPSREVRPSAEGNPEWVTLERVARLPVVEDLPFFLPRLLRFRPGDPPFFALSHYDEEGRLWVEV